jgi:AcrR family transcriptional regulator
MSGKKMTPKVKPRLKAKPKPKMDRRERRTRDALGDALIDLMQQRPFKSIKVQDVLDRADVSRATFYAHYRGKDDLFFSDVEEFWEMVSSMLDRCGEDSNRVAPVRELFSHVGKVKGFREALVASGKVHDVMEQGKGQFARAIEQRLMKLTGSQGSGQYTAQAHAFAGALFSMLNWWIDRGMPVSAAEMDDSFHQLVWSGVNMPSREPAAKSARSASR